MSTAIITNKGLALLAKLTKGNTLDITGAKTGAGKVDSTTLRDQTDVTTPMQSFDIQGINDLGNGECDLILSLTNKGLTDGYAVSQIGIFARDPDEGEVLYSIYQDDSKDKTNIPSESKRPGYNAEWTYRIKYDQADSVNVTVDPANAVSMAVMENYVGAQLKRFVPITRTVNGKALDKDIVLTAADVGAVTAGEVDGAMTAANVKKKFDSADIITTTGTGAAYVATVPGITELKAGVSFTMIPHTASTTNQPTLNVNGWGAKNVRQPLTTNTGATTTADLDTWLTAGKPVRVRYDGALWEIDIPRPSATALYGTVPINHGGTDADNAADALANLLTVPLVLVEGLHYGDELPAPGTPGRIFFKKVEE